MTPQEQKDNERFLRLYYESLKKNAEELNEKAGKIGEKMQRHLRENILMEP